jgi:hypothetical protein
MLKKLLYLTVAISVLGCTDSQTPPKLISPTNKSLSVDFNFPSVISWNAELDGDSQKLWLTEARKRFVNPVLFACHGGYEINEIKVGDETVTDIQWWCYPDAPRKPMSVQAAADTLANLYPDRDIVFTVCNPQGSEIKTKRVWYAKQKVWIVPDDFQPSFEWMRHETDRDFDGVGSIWEFVSYDGHIEQPIAKTNPIKQPTTKSSK